MRSRSVVTAWVACAGTFACAELPFSPHRPDNVASDLIPLSQRLAPEKVGYENAAGTPMVIAVSPEPEPKIIAYDLATEKALWTQKGRVDSRIVIAGNAIVAREGESMVARELSSGAVRWRRTTEGGDTFMGVASDGDGVYYVTEEAGPRRAGRDISRVVSLDARSGAERFDFAARTRLGAPAARNGLVFVPFGFQWIAVLDGGTGAELARIRDREQAINFVRSAAESVFYGGRAICRLDRKSVSGRRADSTCFEASLPEEFFRPLYHFDGYNAAQAGYTAFDRNRVLWIPKSDGTGFDGMVVLHSYRYFFGLDPATGQVRWAYSFPRVDVVASAHTGAHVVFVTSEGDIVTLDARSGAELGRARLPTRVSGATFDVRGFIKKNAEAGPAPDLRQTLLEIVWDPDRRFEAVKLFALATLAGLKDENVTRDLIRVVTHEKIDRKIYQRAADMLIERCSPADVPLIVEALSVRTSYLEETRARGVDVLAAAAGKLKAKETVQPLLAHFSDPETTPVALREIARALGQIGSKVALGPFRQFLLTYRVDADLAKEPEVLRRVSEVLLTLGLQHDRQLVRFVAEDPQTMKYLREYTAGALRGESTDKKKKGHGGSEKPKQSEGGAARGS